MKKIIFTLNLLLFMVALTQAQAPGMFNYQGVARNATGNVLGNKTISLKLTIRDNNANGTIVYSETRQVTTNSFGLFTVQVGSREATNVIGTIAGVQWHNGSKFLQVEIDPDGGNAYLQVGTTQLLSVPYALYSESGLPVGPAGGDLTGSFPNPVVARIRGTNVTQDIPNTHDVLGFDGTNWAPVSMAMHPENYWRLNGSDIFSNNMGNTGIGINTPLYKLDVQNSDTGYVARFENTDADKGDGILIKLGKTHPRWTGSAFVNLPIPALQSMETQHNQIRDWIYGRDAFSTDDLVNLVPYNFVPGAVCNLTNYISQQLNDALSLPLEIGPYRTPQYTLIPRTEIFGGLSLPALPDVPSISIGPYTIPALTVVPRITVFPRIPNISCGSLPSISWPVINFTDVSNSLTKDNEFITFADKDGRKLGSIRAQSIENFSYDYFDGVKITSLADQMIGLDLVKDVVGVLAAIYEMQTDYNNIGVEYNSGNGDYAEWLERIDPKEMISAGDIVAVKGGKITKQLEGAEQIMAVSYRPIVLGNMPGKEKMHLGNNIAFMGQIPVKIMGAVHAGDYIVAKGEVPGFGTAVNPRNMTTEDFRLAVGRSWETNERTGPKMVNTVVGVHNNDFLRIVEGMQKKIENNDSRLKAIEEKLGLAPNTFSPPPKKAF